MTAVGTGSSWAALLPGLVVTCAGTGLFNPAVVAVGLGSVAPEQSGLASGVNDAFRQGGIAVGVAAFGALVPAAAALGHGSAAAYVTGLHQALLIGAGLAAAGAVGTVALLVPRRPSGDEQPAVAADALTEVA